MEKETDPKRIAISKCICRACPSYVDEELKKGFCFVGKSSHIKAEKGCICGGCPVKKEQNLESYYFCMKGTEREQTKQ